MDTFAASRIVIYPRPESATDERSEYITKVLTLALEKSGVAYQVRPSVLVMPKGRSLEQLKQGLDVDVISAVTTREREIELLPIRIPIDKGLLGWRLLLIHAGNRHKFESIKNLEQLRNYQAGLAHDWADVGILRANGLRVVNGANYETLFNMLQAERFDYFPRSVVEIWDEEKNHKGMDIEVETSLLLHYRSAQYFFVNKENKELAADIERGLLRAVKDGSFDVLFEHYNGPFLRRANMKSRTVIELENPSLPVDMPLAERAFWYQK